jgi:hypothetical protein
MKRSWLAVALLIILAFGTLVIRIWLANRRLAEQEHQTAKRNVTVEKVRPTAEQLQAAPARFPK